MKGLFLILGALVFGVGAALGMYWQEILNRVFKCNSKKCIKKNDKN